MALKILGRLTGHPSVPPAGTDAVYTLTTDDHIYLKNTTGTFDLTGGAANHNDLSGLQGGTAGEYYHLTSAQHTLATQVASGSQTGLLSSTDWTTFNNKQDAITTGDLTEATSTILTILGGTGAVIGSGTSIQVQQANTSQSGYLSSTDWNTFNDKSDYADPLTTNGDIVIRSGGATTRLPIGSADQVLTVSSGLPSWEDASGGAAELPKNYIEGLQAVWVSDSTLQIAVGSCRSDDDTTDLVLTGTENAVLSSSGAGGLDTGSESSSTGYYLWLIYNPGTLDYAAMFSESATSPTMPSGYTKKRLVGYSYNTSSSNLLEFKMTGDGRERIVQYDESRSSTLRVLSSGTATTWTDVDLSDLVPENAYSVWVHCQVPDFDNIAYVRPNGFTGATSGLAFCFTDTQVNVELLCDDQIIEYDCASGTSLTIDLTGYRVVV